MRKDGLGDRMKGNYEVRSRTYLTRRTPVIMRLDGKAFHTLTKRCEKPYDQDVIDSMVLTTKVLLSEIQGAKCGYVQSDEISILITDYDALETQAWFDYNVQKMGSISASVASVAFTSTFIDTLMQKGRIDHVRPPMAYFDSRVFNIPNEEIINYFRWRFQDWKRNSVSMLAQSLFSQKQLNGKSSIQQKDMIREKGADWDFYPEQIKYGTFIHKRSELRYSEPVQVGAITGCDGPVSRNVLVETSLDFQSAEFKELLFDIQNPKEVIRSI